MTWDVATLTLQALQELDGSGLSLAALSACDSDDVSVWCLVSDFDTLMLWLQNPNVPLSEKKWGTAIPGLLDASDGVQLS